MDPSIEILERSSFLAWPAAEVEQLDGWRLRHTPGVSRRANSVWPNECDGNVDVEARIGRAERFYGERRATAMFQIGPLACPRDLDAVLEQRGYVVHAPSRVLTADAGVVQARALDGGRAATSAKAVAAVRVSSDLSQEWFDVSGRRGRHAGHASTYLELLRRIPGEVGYALATFDGEPAAVGLGVCQPPWLAIASMWTLTQFRRRGAARAILAGLEHWGIERGVTRLYLQVEADNAPARTVYREAGFADFYGYHYRVAPPNGIGPPPPPRLR